MLQSGLRWPNRAWRRFWVPSFHGQKNTKSKKIKENKAFGVADWKQVLGTFFFFGVRVCVRYRNGMWVWSKITSNWLLFEETKKTKTEEGFVDWWSDLSATNGHKWVSKAGKEAQRMWERQRKREIFYICWVGLCLSLRSRRMWSP